MKAVSWNVNGLRACLNKGFANVVQAMNADFFCVQETKLQAGQLDLTLPGYTSYWDYAEKKGYAGTAIFTKEPPLSVSYGIGSEEHGHEGRCVTLEYPNYYLITLYSPNSQEGLRRLSFRLSFEAALRRYLKSLDMHKAAYSLRGFQCGASGNRSEKPWSESGKCRIFGRRAGGLRNSARIGLYGYFSSASSQPNGGLQLVVLSIQCQTEQRRMAD